jgi:hypothetical protein
VVSCSLEAFCLVPLFNFYVALRKYQKKVAAKKNTMEKKKKKQQQKRALCVFSFCFCGGSL